MFDISTDIEVEIKKQKIGWFKKEATVFIKEALQNKPAMFVQAHFEFLANYILKEQLLDIKPQNIKWVHYNPYHNKHNAESIKNYDTIIPTFKKNEIVGAEWHSLIN
jgi:hypothetical protein